MVTTAKRLAKPASDKPKVKRPRRSAEEIVADLEEKIERTKARAAAKAARGTPDGRAMAGVRKAIEKAVVVAQREGNTGMAAALNAATAALDEPR